MPCSILVAAVDFTSFKKGEAASVHDLPHEWGNLERLPDFIHVDVSDAPASEMFYLPEPVPLEFDFEIQSENPLRYRYRYQVKPSLVSATGIGGESLTDDMERWVEDNYDGTIVNTAPTNVIVDIPKPAPSEAVIQDDFNDSFHDILSFKRWYVASADVDAIALLPDGEKTFTKAEALVLFHDKLDD